ncbi:MAG: DUF4173 domain-containing protein [Myxococcales bacterium]|nr:DUF4173 domain-containing protein [Myxococcales bacterium]
MSTVSAVEASSSAVAQALSRPRSPRRTLWAALGLGLAVEILFDGHRLGVSFPLFVAAGLGALLWVGGRESLQRARPNLWLAGPLLFFAAMVCIREDPFLTSLNVLACAFLALLLSHFWAADRVGNLGLLQYPSLALRTALRALLWPPLVIASGIDLAAARAKAGPKLVPVLRGLAIAFPVLLVFGWLLAAADPVFASLLGRLLSWEGSNSGTVSAALVTLGASFAIAGLIAHALRRSPGSELSPPGPARARLGFIEGMMLLVSVDALFLAFALVQAAYLFGRAGAAVGSGTTFSEVARRGFFELVAVTAMALLLLMALHRWVRLEGAVQARAFKLACAALVGLAVVIVSSAHWRLGLYEEAYGHTELRLYSHAFIFALAAVLLWRVLTIFWRPERFALGAFLCGLAYLAALDLLNPHELIARKNLDRYRATGVLDTWYLSGLSADAVPALAESLDELGDGQAAVIRSRLLARWAAPSDEPIWAFHLARERARESVEPRGFERGASRSARPRHVHRRRCAPSPPTRLDGCHSTLDPRRSTSTLDPNTHCSTTSSRRAAARSSGARRRRRGLRGA